MSPPSPPWLSGLAASCFLVEAPEHQGSAVSQPGSYPRTGFAVSACSGPAEVCGRSQALWGVEGPGLTGTETPPSAMPLDMFVLLLSAPRKAAASGGRAETPVAPCTSHCPTPVPPTAGLRPPFGKLSCVPPWSAQCLRLELLPCIKAELPGRRGPWGAPARGSARPPCRCLL